MNNFFDVITLGGIVFIIFLAGLVLPFVIEDIWQQRKSNKLATQIANSEDYERYNLKLLNILLSSEKVNSKYLRFLVRRVIYYIHKKAKVDKEKLKYFQDIYEKLDIDEVYDGISQPLLTQIKTLGDRLDEPSQMLLLNLTHNIKMLENKKKLSENFNVSLTAISILVTIIGLVYSVFF